jgi:hypothetical protein
MRVLTIKETWLELERKKNDSDHFGPEMIK